MKPSPLVSIVTPSYNAAPYIRETADSIFAQTFSEWEWIIVDDGSTDGTREIVSTFIDSRVRIIESEHSGLPATARNKAIAQSTGPYVAFVDADDIWLPEKLSLQLACFESSPETGLVFSKSLHLYDEIDRVGRGVHPSTKGVPNPGMLFAQLCFRNVVYASSVVVRRRLLEEHGLMNDDPQHRGTEDYELWLRLAPHTQFAWVDRPLMIHRVSPTSLSHNAVLNVEGRLLALEKALERNPELPLHPQLVGRNMNAWKLFWLGHAQLRDGVERCGRAAFWHSLRINPLNKLAWAWLAVSYLGPTWQRRLRRLAYRFV